MPIATLPNGNIGDYVTVSGVVAEVSGDYATTSGTIADYTTVSGDYATTSGTVSDYATLSGDYSTHQDSSTSHHDPTGYESISGDYLTTSGTIADYPVVSGDYSMLSGSVADYPVHSGSVANPHHVRLDQIEDPTAQNEINMGDNHLHFTFDAPTVGSHSGAFSIEAQGGFEGPLLYLSQNTGNPNTVSLAHIYSEDADVISLLVEASSVNTTGLRIATGIICMNNQGKICGMIDPVGDQDAVTKKYMIDYYTGLSGDYVITSGDYATTSGTVDDYIEVSGDYATTSGTVDGYAAHVASSTSHHDPTGYDTVSGDYITHAADSTAHHDPTGYDTVSGAWESWGLDLTGLSGYGWSFPWVSGNNETTGLILGASGLFLSSTGPSAAPVWAAGGAGGGISGISEADAENWRVFYSNGANTIIELAIGASGLCLSSNGVDQAPIWSSKVAGGGDDLGSHVATQILDMATFKVTGMGDPVADQDAATKKWTDDHNWLEADITDFDSSGLFNVSGDYLTTSGTIDDYIEVSGDYATTSGTVDGYAAHIADANAHIDNLTDITTREHSALSSIGVNDHHNPSGYETVSGDYWITSGTIDGYAAHIADANAHIDNITDITTRNHNDLGSISVDDHHSITGILAMSGDYLITSGTVDGYAAHIANTNAHIDNITDITTRDHNDLGSISVDDHHSITGILAMSGDYLITSGTVDDYIAVSGDYATTSGTVSDYVTVSGVAATALQNIVEDLTPQLGGALDINKKQILYTSGLATTEYNGIVVSGIVDTNTVGFGGLLHIEADGHWGDANASSGMETSMPGQGMAMEASAGTKALLLNGYVRNDSWTFTAGNNLYTQTGAGVITDALPSGSNHQVQRIGYAISANEIYFNPSMDVVTWD